MFLDCDVTDPTLGADKGLPDHASVGMHVLGYPERLARRPYVRQARRLFARYAKLRERIDHDDEDWWEALTDAAVSFELTGDLPRDEPL